MKTNHQNIQKETRFDTAQTRSRTQSRKENSFSWRRQDVPSRQARIDALYCPFPRRRNPYTDEMTRLCKRWLDRFSPSTDFSKKAINATMSEFTAGFYPEASLDQLCLATDYLHWIFALDDLGDESEAGQSPTELAKLFESFEPLLRGERTNAKANTTLRALDDIMQRFAGFATDTQLAAFADANRVYFRAMMWESRNREKGCTPDEFDFQNHRPAAGAVPPFFELIFPINNVCLPDRVRFHPNVMSLVNLAGRVVCWINDVLSYEKEKLVGESHNLVIVLETKRGLPTGDAFSEAIALSNREVNDFVTQAAILPTFGEFESELRRYIATLESMMRITLDWTSESCRYHERPVALSPVRV